jgi:DNA-directed RNA polymerase subunit RPC12/RpoP
MCRYGFKSYKPHYACFTCKKVFKRRLLSDITKDATIIEVNAKCPQCKSLMANMAMDFAAPKKTETKKWEHLKTLYSVGITYGSCGCAGPGYIPNTHEALVKHFTDILKGFIAELHYWHKRTEPKNQSEMDEEKNKNMDRLMHVPWVQNEYIGAIKNADAIAHWNLKVKEVQQKLDTLTK